MNDTSDFCSHALSTPPWLRFRNSKYIVVGHQFLNFCVTFFVFLRELPLFHYFGPSVGLMCWVLASVRSQRNSNLCRKTVSDFLSDVLTTPPWLQFRISNFIGVGHCFLNCPITLFPFLKELPHFIVSDFLMVRCVGYWGAKSVAQQDSNLRRKTLSDL